MAKAEERILREVAILAEKLDVTEELVRLRTHIEQFSPPSRLPTRRRSEGPGFFNARDASRNQYIRVQIADSEISSLCDLKSKVNWTRFANRCKISNKFMNLSRNWNRLLFESFSTSSNAASWPNLSIMSGEATLKSVKKSFKNQIFRIWG